MGGGTRSSARMRFEVPITIRDVKTGLKNGLQVFRSVVCCKRSSLQRSIRILVNLYRSEEVTTQSNVAGLPNPSKP